jgi:CheY-like chemotaxis protein
MVPFVGRHGVLDKKVELVPEQEGNNNATVLVVEDEVLVRMCLADRLRLAGYTVIEAANADEALTLLEHSVDMDVKVVVSDIHMPGSIDGAGLARIVRSTYPMTKILLTSGQHTAFDGVAHDGFFPKPYNPAKIVNYIATHFD